MLQATSLVSVLGGTAIAGGLCVSFIADRVDRVRLLAGLFVLEALVNAALAIDTSYPTFVAAAAMLGICSGTVVATNFLCTFIREPFAVRNRHAIGVDNMMW